jgi:hypothetical protein
VAHGRWIGCGSGWASARRSGGRQLDAEVAERVAIDLQPRAATRTPTSSRTRWDDYAKWHFGLTVGAKDGTKARYAFVYGDFRRIHRMGLIACSYRAAESRHKEIELTADELLQYLDTKSERRRKR